MKMYGSVKKIDFDSQVFYSTRKNKILNRGSNDLETSFIGLEQNFRLVETFMIVIF